MVFRLLFLVNWLDIRFHFLCFFESELLFLLFLNFEGHGRGFGVKMPGKGFDLNKFKINLGGYNICVKVILGDSSGDIVAEEVK